MLSVFITLTDIIEWILDYVVLFNLIFSNPEPG